MTSKTFPCGCDCPDAETCCAAGICSIQAQQPEQSHLAAPQAGVPLAYEAQALTGSWQPIETTPKDGTHILITNGKDVTVGHWLHQEPYIREHRDLEGRYIGQDESDGFDGWIDWAGGIPGPTHWMPLPAPPFLAKGENTATGQSDGCEAAEGTLASNEPNEKKGVL